MGHIKILDEYTRSKIAAGEVVDRPASVVKELIENAIDAKATAITVDIENGGLSLMRVTDNGYGMDSDDAVLAFERHATSKITDADDLDGIVSLGFRGEALASIAAVAKVRLETVKHGFAEGVFVELEGGRLMKQGPVGGPGGTTVMVSELFFNTPARLKFLKSASAEAARIKDVIDRFVLGYPQISFRYANGGKSVLHSPGSGDLRTAIAAVYGSDTAKQMVSVYYEVQNIKISGYVGLPDISRTNRAFQTFFVNGRFVHLPLISKTLDEAFNTLLMVNHFPFCVLNIDLDPHEVDVNVHPAKIEVRFIDEKKVAKAVFYAVRQALYAQGLLGVNDKGQEQEEDKPLLQSVQETILPPMRDVSVMFMEKKYTPVQREFIKGGNVKETASSYEINVDLPTLRVIGSVFSTYLLIEDKDQLYIIDQHAAHERILYERYRQMLEKHNIEVQYLLSPILLELTSQEKQIVEENKDILHDMGFEVEEFGPDSYALKSVPVLFGQPKAQRLFMDIIDAMRIQQRGSPYDYVEQDIMIMACRSAVKAGDLLSSKDVLELVSDILSGKVAPTCPHGRPIVHRMTRYELEKMFKRIQ